MQKFDTVVLGAGPAGLAAAYELSKKGRRVAVLEKDDQVGGISKTMKFDGCYFDLGGHRFHTDYSEVMELWEKILGEDFLSRPRLSRIYYKNKFFDYPLTPVNAVFGLGVFESIFVMLSYLRSHLFPEKEEKTFEQWVSNRFGRRLFRTFFKTYTEKVWGIPCQEIQAEWAEQRIKSLSLAGAIKNAFFPNKKNKAVTLIDKFRYPKLGPGMMYERMAGDIEKMGGKIILSKKIEKIICSGENTVSQAIAAGSNGEKTVYEADQFISTIPLDNLVTNMEPAVPEEVMRASSGLKYRNFIVVNVIFECPNPFPDNWIYIHSPEIKMGRIQNYKNWSPYMVNDKNRTTLGLEFFCDFGDEFWNMPDNSLIKLALTELKKTRLIRKGTFTSGFVTRVPKAYPVYDAGYTEKVQIIRQYLDRFKNIQTIGRSGMFRYNNMDHSVLAGIWAAKNIMGEKHDVWEIND